VVEGLTLAPAHPISAPPAPLGTTGVVVEELQEEPAGDARAPEPEATGPGA
jgi:hypothetical protein